MNEGNKGHSDDQDAGRTADSVEGWLRGLGQRGPSHDAVNDRPRRSPGIGARRASGDDEAEAFLRAVRRLASSPQGQQALAARLSGDDPGSSDPELNALAQVFASLGRELGRQGGEPGSTGVLDRPDILDQITPLLADGGGGGGDDFLDDDEDDGDGDDDDEPWPSAFVGYRTGVVDNVDLGNCRDGCCTALFVDHPGVRAAVWFPTDHAAGLATAIGEHLNRSRGEDAVLSVLPFGAGAAPPRGIVQATIQFFTDDIHLDPVEHETDRAQGGVVRFLAYDQGLGHGGPPLVDILLDASQAKAIRKGLRRASRNAPRGGHDQGMHE